MTPLSSAADEASLYCSSISAFGILLGASASYQARENLFINADLNVSVLQGTLDTTYRTANNFGQDNYNQGSNDKNQMIQHLNTKLSVAKNYQAKKITTMVEAGYRFDLFFNTVKILHFRDDDTAGAPVSTLHNMAFSGPYLKLSMQAA